MNKINIHHRCYDLKNRPKVSYKIRNYFEDFLTRELLIPKGIIVNSIWNIHLYIEFKPEEMTSQSKNIEFDIFGPHIYRNDSIKAYSIFVSFNITFFKGDELHAYIDVLFNVLKGFFVLNYKKITSAEFEKLKKLLDYNFLLNFPYPDSFANQKYIDDNENIEILYNEINQ